jgi:hypothetical protein
MSITLGPSTYCSNTGGDDLAANVEFKCQNTRVHTDGWASSW